MSNYTKIEQRRKALMELVERRRANPPKEWTQPPCDCGAPSKYHVAGRWWWQDKFVCEMCAEKVEI